MKLIIDIPDEKYEAWKLCGLSSYMSCEDRKILDDAITYGIPLNKPHIKGNYYHGFKNGLRTAKWRYDKIRAEIWDLQYGNEEKSMTDEDRADAYNNAIRQVIEIIDKHMAERSE